MKALKTRDDSGWAPSVEEDMYGTMGGGAAWVEDTMFA